MATDGRLQAAPRATARRPIRGSPTAPGSHDLHGPGSAVTDADPPCRTWRTSGRGSRDSVVGVLSMALATCRPLGVSRGWGDSPSPLPPTFGLQARVGGLHGSQVH